MKTTVHRAQTHLFAALAACWAYAGALLALLPATSQGLVGYAVSMPWYSIGLAWAGWYALRHGRSDQGWAHALAAVLLALPRFYTLPTDLFGALPTVGLNLVVGLYLHMSLLRNLGPNDLPLRKGFGSLLAITVALPILHVLVAQGYAAIKTEWLALR